MPAILDSFFTGVANTSSTPIGWKGVGGQVATKWLAKAKSTVKTAKWWHPLVPFSLPHITQSSSIHGQTHQPVAWWITASRLFVKRRWSHLKTTWALVDIWQASKTSHSKSSLGNFQHQYLAELLSNVYSYHLMVKNVSCCCIHGSWLFSNAIICLANYCTL